VLPHLSHAPRVLRGLEDSAVRNRTGTASDDPDSPPHTSSGDYARLRGSGIFKRALSVAAAGGHHLIVVGPPGAGKSMGVGLLPSILPPLRRKEALEVTRIHSIAGELDPSDGLARHRPFRAPHHNSSTEGLLGGGRGVRPGEVSLAHRGVLFLDEALEFRRPVLQGLREPLERGRVHISRAGHTYWFPAAFQLCMAANPCPCGNLGRADRVCLCSLAEVDRYWRRIGGPLLDRVDVRVAVRAEHISSLPATEGSSAMRQDVAAASQRARERNSRYGCEKNADIPVELLFDACRMSERARSAYRAACEKLRLSTRASVSVARVARTIADLSSSETVSAQDVLEAVAHRRNGEDRPLWSLD
jgi:magnesium chelatase family protein